MRLNYSRVFIFPNPTIFHVSIIQFSMFVKKKQKIHFSIFQFSIFYKIPKYSSFPFFQNSMFSQNSKSFKFSSFQFSCFKKNNYVSSVPFFNFPKIICWSISIFYICTNSWRVRFQARTKYRINMLMVVDQIVFTCFHLFGMLRARH